MTNKEKEAILILKLYKRNLEDSCSNLLEDDIKAFDFAIKTLEGWSELKETIEELSENEGVSSQQEVCKFLINLMGVIEGDKR